MFPWYFTKQLNLWKPILYSVGFLIYFHNCMTGQFYHQWVTWIIYWWNQCIGTNILKGCLIADYSAALVLIYWWESEITYSSLHLLSARLMDNTIIHCGVISKWILQDNSTLYFKSNIKWIIVCFNITVKDQFHSNIYSWLDLWWSVVCDFSRVSSVFNSGSWIPWLAKKWR